MKARILIVGGGAMGTSIALHAASRCDPIKEPVILIEKGHLGAGSSGRSGGIVHQTYSSREMAGMSRDALKAYATFEQSTGRSVGFRRTGVLLIAGSNHHSIHRLDQIIEIQKEVGIEVERLEADDIRQICPGIEVEDGTIGAFEKAGGFVDPTRTIESLAAMARSRGATTRVGVANPRILVEGGKAVGVETSAGTFYAPQIVVATGPWTGPLLGDLGVDLPLRIVRVQESFVEAPSPEQRSEEEAGLAPLPGSDAGQIDRDLLETRFHTVDPTDSMPVAHPVIVDFEHRFYARHQVARGQTRVGRLGVSNLQELEHPDALTQAVEDSFQSWAHESLAGRLPIYRDMKTADSRASWISLTPDQIPIVGPVQEIEGLFVVAGFSGNDFHLAPSIGEGMAQMLLGQPVSAFSTDFFSLERFKGQST